MTAFDKLKNKLAELFQLDQADLDFGIYRIMNARREEINQFLEKDLLPQVQSAFEIYKSSDKDELQKELDRVTEGVKAAGMNPDDAPKVVELREKLAEYGVDTKGMENDVYDHLYSFFSRYYDEGDFISLRRYKEGVYAIPYEGEEVKLHWANHDQYYIKTSEYFKDYTFRLSKVGNAHFKIVEADTEKDNIKSIDEKDRRFILDEEQPVFVEGGELFIRMEYRSDIQKRKQDAINGETARKVLDNLDHKDYATWQKALSGKWRNAKGEVTERTILEKHLADYTKRNTFDYFIHKDLDSFLKRELDFYIKNEVMRLDDVENESAARVEQYLSKIKVIRRIAHKIIAFLSHIEEFQKKLWLKKKFVIETNYCITLDRVPEGLYPEIAKNTDQHDEWVKLFAIDKIKGDLVTPAYSNPLTVDFLKSQKNLLLDTKYFEGSFVLKVLSSIENMDNKCDGLLVKSENFQGLHLLQKRYKGDVNYVHIDPPYNTATSGFLYKNSYEHSSWLSMMNDRIELSSILLDERGEFLCHIDENEYERLNIIFDRHSLNAAGTVIWDKKNPMLGRKGIATQHEYIIWRSKHDSSVVGRSESITSMQEQVKGLVEESGGDVEQARLKYRKWLSKQDHLSGGEKAYKYIDESGNIYRLVAMGAPEKRTDPKFHIPLKHPITRINCPVPPNGWSRTPETLSELIDNGLIVFGTDEKTQPQKKVFLRDDARKQITSVYSDGKSGKSYLDPMGLEFPYCHPVSMYEHLLSVASGNATFIDFFAGSGTNGHAVLNLMRSTNAHHKSILVEMGDHFDEVLIPRIQKVVYSKDWKDGIPISREGISYMFKYMTLESYEDALANIHLYRDDAQQTLLDGNANFRESYMLNYMLDVESRGSLLDIDQFDDPWGYKLLVGQGSAGETKPVNVDLIETFNWLIGIKVKHVDQISGFTIIEGQNLSGDNILVIWRKIRDLSETDAEKIGQLRVKANSELEAFFSKQQYNTLDSEYDIIYVNGDNNLMNVPLNPDKAAIEPRYKVRLIEEEFQKLMFDTRD
jgi:adenine-specific DNA-methyltransferase